MSEPSPPPLPPLGELPRRMLAAVIRRDRYGAPATAYQMEIVAVPPVGPRQVLVMVMAAGINFNGVWAALGKPLDVIASRHARGDRCDFHVGGSDGSGVVWAVGEQVTQLAMGDAVILSGLQPCTPADGGVECGPTLSRRDRVWGYEANYGSFAQFSVVDVSQCHRKPSRLTWEEAACFLVSAATAYRQLNGWPPNTVQPCDPVLIWGGAGGLGSMAIQLARRSGGVPIAVVSKRVRADHCLRLGARGVIDRTRFTHWGRPPDSDDPAGMESWLAGVRAFGREFWNVLGERRNPRIVLEHSGRDTLPTSLFLCDDAGMVVICGGTTGYMGSVDLRNLWMRQKRLQGSSYASTDECRAVIELVDAGAIDPCLSSTLPFHEVGRAHQLMYDNAHPPGQMAVLVNAPHAGLRNLEE